MVTADSTNGGIYKACLLLLFQFKDKFGVDKIIVKSTLPAAEHQS